MNKELLTEEFEKWLNANLSDKFMNSIGFAEYEIDRLLKTEPIDCDTLFENDAVFVGSYKYSYILDKSQCADKMNHSFTFEAIGIGSKENVTENDYELDDYTEHTFIIK